MTVAVLGRANRSWLVREKSWQPHTEVCVFKSVCVCVWSVSSLQVAVAGRGGEKKHVAVDAA